MISSYLLFKIFGFIRDNLSSYVVSSQDDLNKYKSIFIAPQVNARERQFQIKGQSLPFICIWQKSPIEYNKETQARSCLWRDIKCKDDTDGSEKLIRALVQDRVLKFSFFAGGSFVSWRDEIQEELLQIDQRRYFSIPMPEFVNGFVSKVELLPEGFSSQEQGLGSDSNQRMFSLQVDYKMTATIILAKEFEYKEKIKLYLEDNQKWLRVISK